MNPIRSIALLVNREKTGARALAGVIRDIAEARGVNVHMTDAYPVPKDFLKEVDACGVLGGDGTLLSIIQESVAHNVPVFGVNQGKLGFLATFSPNDIQEQFPAILDGQYCLDTRTLLQVEASDGQKHLALNDVVLKNAHNSRLITLKVYCDNKLVTRYHCDGLIFATPTGSTAYNLSANGPIVNPGSSVITMTPICPHTLTNRSLVFPSEVVLEIKSETDNPPDLHIDGKTITTTKPLPLRISKSSSNLPLLQPLDYDYFHILRNKLHWGNEAQ